MNFKGKTFWITGAASGMGKSVSIALSKHQTTLILSDRDADGLLETARAVEQNGSKARIEPLDMSNTPAIFDTVQKVLGDGLKIDGLYQFAGISQRSLVTETPLDNDRKIMEINFFGVVALTKAVLPHMIENGGGQLAAASSLVGSLVFRIARPIRHRSMPCTDFLKPFWPRTTNTTFGLVCSLVDAYRPIFQNLPSIKMAANMVKWMPDKPTALVQKEQPARY